MVEFQDIRDYLKENVFLRDDLKKSVEIIHFKLIKNSINEQLIQFDSQDVIYGIPLRYEAVRKKYDSAGIYSDSSLLYLVPYDTEVSPIDKIYVFGQYYDVKGIDEWVGGEETLGKKIYLVQTNVNLPTPSELLDWNTDLDDVIQFKLN